MNIVIIEDETPAAEKLERYLLKYNSSANILATLKSIAQSVQWFDNHPTGVDLIFMDIQLLDGLSFEIFEKTKVNAPVIFTTAYDEYAIDAFKVNSVDYLLKPITFTALQNAMKKLDSLTNALSTNQVSQIKEQWNGQKNKTRFMVKVGEHIKSVTIDEIVLFYAEGRTVYLYTDKDRRFIIDQKLEELEQLLDGGVFFRANRSFILNINYIQDVLVYSNSRLKITTAATIEKEIIVSREKVVVFKEWFDGK